MRSVCVFFLVVALAGLTPPTHGQFQFPPDGDSEQRLTQPVRPTPAVFPRPITTTTQAFNQQPGSSTLPPANPEVPVVFTVKCDCLSTPEYNPVCGSDGQTYGNRQILNCARSCGENVNFVMGGSCGQNRG